MLVADAFAQPLRIRSVFAFDYRLWHVSASLPGGVFSMKKLLIVLLPILLFSAQLPSQAQNVSFGIPLPFPFLFYNFGSASYSQPYYGGYYRRPYYGRPAYYYRPAYYGYRYYRPYYPPRYWGYGPGWYGYGAWRGYYGPGYW
jgi:hypothetical protein